MRSVSIVGLLLLFVVPAHASENKSPPGLGNPGELQSLQLHALQNGVSDDAPVCVLAGRDAAAQVVITGSYSSGQLRDLTRDLRYTTEPENVVAVDSNGYITPLNEGAATIIATADGGIRQVLNVQVTNQLVDVAVNFPNQVVPVFTKYGCNGGGCHGKSGGQNGFRLSLLGFVPTEDYHYLVKENRGRRLFPAAPERSLLLQKAIGAVPHGGGARLEQDSPPYRLMRRWVEQGMPYGEADDPVIDRIEVLPRERIMPREGQQQLVVLAHYSDGSSRDVTHMTQFESNDGDLAEVSETGLVSTATATGSVAIMTRFQSQVDVFRATVPLGLEVDNLPPARNYIDELVFDKLQRLGLPPSEIADDSTFLRRVTIDIAGRLPTQAETLAYLQDRSDDKRESLVDRLLDSGDYADYFANKWSSVLRNRRNDKNIRITSYGFHDWIRDSIYRNKPFDQFAGEILSASGMIRRNPPVAWFHEVKDASSQVEDTAQLFLGLRIQCAKCHHHPFEKWSQDDYYGMAAFFSRIGRKKSDVKGKDHIFHNVGLATAKNPASGLDLKPTPLGAEPVELRDEVDPRRVLADWLADSENPFFARALVNRYWKHFFGRGLVEPEDDMRVTNPASNPALLDALAADFTDTGFDLKSLVRRICTSQVYALSSVPNDYNQKDKQNFSRFYPRRLNAEVLLDSIDRLTAMPTKFGGIAQGTRAVQLPDNAFDSYFLTVFGRPESASACECERSSDVNLAQCLHLLNSDEVQQKVGGKRAQALTTDDRQLSDRISDLYVTAFSRRPTSDELRVAVGYVEDRPDQTQKAFEDLLWALMNTKEFVFNH